jgi:hypothetical protein
VSNDLFDSIEKGKTIMKKIITSRIIGLVLPVTLLMVLLAPPVSAADFFAIVDNFGRKAGISQAER